MLDSVKVQKTYHHDNKENKMIRGLHKACGYRGFLLEPYVTSMQVSCNSTKAGKTRSTQNLPRLPVPKLKDTLSKYLLSVRPFLNDSEFEKTKCVCKDFERGPGEKLQEILEKRAENTTNWLEEWWLNTAYLGYRNPVVVHSNPGLVFPLREFQSEDEQLKFAAKTLMAVLEYKSLIDNDKIPLEKMGKFPLDMGQYKKVIGTCRIPAEKIDKISYNSTTRHVTVIHNNHIFHIDVWGDDNVMLNEDQIFALLKMVVERSETPDEYGVGVLTSEHRDTWAKAYKLLCRDKKNQDNLVDVESSIVVLCLDAAAGMSNCCDDDARRNLAGAQTIHGCGTGSNGCNRWFDKTIQLIVGADGITGLTYEHSPAEGQPIAVLTDFLIKFIDQDKGANRPPSLIPKPPRLLEFNVSEVASMIEDAKGNLDKLVADLDLNCFQFKHYGKNFIKSKKLSPDSYLQMAMQFAFFRLHQTPAAHYESAATRMFEGGRTETIRSCSIESVKFAQTMLSAHSSPKEKIAALKRAINSHKNYTVQALQGLGVDRHLLGLKLAAIENGMEIPQFYSDPSFTRSSHMRIASSQVALKADGFMCYGPSVPDGYATCYNPRDDDVNFAAAAFVEHPETSSSLYRCALEQSLIDMHDVFVFDACCSKL